MPFGLSLSKPCPCLCKKEQPFDKLRANKPETVLEVDTGIIQPTGERVQFPAPGPSCSPTMPT